MTGILVSGASVAGTTAAYWLARQGYSVTVVERHPGLRPGGQAIDVRGPALAVLERMTLRAAADHRRTRIRGASVVDRDGNELSDEFRSCLDTGPPVPFDQVRDCIEADLGTTLFVEAGAGVCCREYLLGGEVFDLDHLNRFWDIPQVWPRKFIAGRPSGEHAGMGISFLQKSFGALV